MLLWQLLLAVIEELILEDEIKADEADLGIIASRCTLELFPSIKRRNKSLV